MCCKKLDLCETEREEVAVGQYLCSRAIDCTLRPITMYAFLAKITIRTFLCSGISQDLTRFMLGSVEDLQLLTV